LDGAMHLSQSHDGWDLNPPPDHRADAAQPDLELQGSPELGEAQEPWVRMGCVLANEGVSQLGFV
jgi:hypothetical protein